MLHLTILFLLLFPSRNHFLCMFVNEYVVYVWDVCNAIYFHLYKEIFMIPLIFKLIDTDNSCHLHDKQSDLYYWS